MSQRTERLQKMERHLRSALDALDKAQESAHWRGPEDEQREHEQVVAYHTRQVTAMVATNHALEQTP